MKLNNSLGKTSKHFKCPDDASVIKSAHKNLNSKYNKFELVRRADNGAEANPRAAQNAAVVKTKSGSH